MNSTDVDNNNNNSVKRANTVLKANNIVGTHVMEEKEEGLYQCADNYDVWNNDSYPPKKGMEMEMGGGGGSHTFTDNTDVFNPTKTKHNRKSKIRIQNEVSTSNKSDFYIGKRQS